MVSLSVFASQNALAGVLSPSPIAGFVGPGNGFGTAVTNSPNNFQISDHDNGLNIISVFTAQTSPVDIVIQDVNSGGITQYDVSYSVGNSTGASFSNITYQLGTGTGAGFVAFTANGTRFQASPSATSNTFSASSLSASQIAYSGGSEAAAGAGTQKFTLNIADQSTTPSTFTLRARVGPAITTVPEPSSVAAFAFTSLGIAGLMLRVQRRRGT